MKENILVRGENMKNKLPLGKLEFSFLEKLLKNYQSKPDSRVIIGPKLGEDAAVIEYPDRYLVAKTDPVTFATDEIGWYAVQVNANDIATRGAVPKWFQATILLPENKTTEELVENIFSQIYNACNQLNIAVIGGHTEISYNLDRPIVVGCMLGEVEKNKLVSTSGARPGDVIILTKGIVIEGTAIIAREKQEELRDKGYSEGFIKKCQNFIYKPGLSVLKEALLANQFEVHAMHDPTEGGLSAGLYEIAQASQSGLLVEKDKIYLLEEAQKLCNEFNLNPLNVLTSGTLLIVTSKSESGKIISLLAKEGINSYLIGEIKERDYGIKIKNKNNNIEKDLIYSAEDEIIRVFK